MTTHADDESDRLKRNRPLIAVAVLLFGLWWLFGSDTDDAVGPVPQRQPDSYGRTAPSAPDPSARARQQRQQFVQQQLRQAIMQRLRQQQARRQRQQQGSSGGAYMHRGHDSGTGGDGQTFYAIGKGWSYTR